MAQKLGLGGIDAAATKIVQEARGNMKTRSGGVKHRGVVQLANAISRYATTSNAEAVAEAFTDCYCNGKKAKAESRAIMAVVDKYLK